MAKNIRKGLTSIVIREMQIKVTMMRSNFILTMLAKTKNSGDSKY